MARGAIAVTTSDRGGSSLPAATVGDPTNGHSIANDGSVMLLVKNTGTTVPRTVTVRIVRTVDGFTVAPRTKAIPVGGTHLFGPYSRDDYGSSLLIDVDNAELTITAIKPA